MSFEIPEWVHVWFWCRHVKGETRSLPQQDAYGVGGEIGLGEVMSPAEYEALRAEWFLVGQPRIRGVADILRAAA